MMEGTNGTKALTIKETNIRKADTQKVEGVNHTDAWTGKEADTRKADTQMYTYGINTGKKEMAKYPA